MLLLNFLISYISQLLVNIISESSCNSWKCTRSSGHRFLYNVLPNSLGRLLCSHSPTVEADEFSGELWQLIAVVHGEGDDLILYD